MNLETVKLSILSYLQKLISGTLYADKLHLAVSKLVGWFSSTLNIGDEHNH